jgi:hypothetical protein
VSAGLDLYTKYSDDILEKLNIVDVVSRLGMTESGCNLLSSHKSFKSIKKEALDPNTDPLISKSLGIMLVELVNHDKLAYSFNLFKDLRVRLEENFLTNFGEELYSCFEMIKSFGKSVEVHPQA